MLSACGKKEQSAKEILLNGIASSAEMDSYHFVGEMGFQFTLPADLLESDPMTASLMQMMENMRIDIDGTYQRDPFQFEANVNLHFTGDTAITVTLPTVLNEKNLWVRIPQVPFFPIPSEAIGKYLEFDLEQWRQSVSPSSLQPQIFDFNKQQEFVMQMLDTFVQHYDEETYFFVLTSEDIKSELSDQSAAEVAAQFAIDEEQWKDAISILVNDVFPEWVELISQPDWSQWLQLDAEDLERLRAKVEEMQTNWAQNSAKLDEEIQFNAFVIQVALDHNDYIVNFNTMLDTIVFDRGEALPVTIELEMQFDEINENPSFEIGIPSKDGSLTMEELMQMFMLSF